MFQVSKCRAIDNILYNVIYKCKFIQQNLIKYDILSFYLKNILKTVLSTIKY